MHVNQFVRSGGSWHEGAQWYGEANHWCRHDRSSSIPIPDQWSTQFSIHRNTNFTLRSVSKGLICQRASATIAWHGPYFVCEDTGPTSASDLRGSSRRRTTFGAHGYWLMANGKRLKTELQSWNSKIDLIVGLKEPVFSTIPLIMLHLLQKQHVMVVRQDRDAVIRLHKKASETWGTIRQDRDAVIRLHQKASELWSIARQDRDAVIRLHKQVSDPRRTHKLMTTCGHLTNTHGWQWALLDFTFERLQVNTPLPFMLRLHAQLGWSTRYYVLFMGECRLGWSPSWLSWQSLSWRKSRPRQESNCD